MALKSSQAQLNHSIIILLSRVNIACWRIPFTCDHYFPSGIASRRKPRLLLERHQAAFTSKNTLSGIVSVQSLQYREATSLSSWEWFPWHGGGVGHSKEHDCRFVQAFICDEGSFPFIAFLDSYIVVSPSDVELGEEFLHSNAVDHVTGSREWIWEHLLDRGK